MTDTSRSGRRVHKAGAFDIRTFIALLMGIYGIALVLTGLFGTSDEQLAKADDFNINLWAGVGMILTAVVLQTWATLRPVIVPADPDDVEKRDS
jgi:hypothetical protein